MNQETSTSSATSPQPRGRSAFLIADPKQRLARAAEKRKKVLALLRDEIWTVTEVVAMLLGVKYAAAHALLKNMQRDDLIVSRSMFIKGSRGAKQVTLHGITPTGLAYAWDLNETTCQRQPWEPGKTNPLFVPHQIETQIARIRAEQNGWQNWTPARLLMNRGLPKLPDAEAKDTHECRIAIEIEREIKTDRRLEAVVGAYISEMKINQRWTRVDYLCPDADFAARLARNFGRLKQLRLESNGKTSSKTGKLEQAHLDRFRFYAADQWPTGNFITAKKVEK